MNKSTLPFVDPGVHSDSIRVAYVETGRQEPPHFDGPIGTWQRDIDKLIRSLQSQARQLILACEAGPCGYVFHRYLTQKRARLSSRRSSLDSSETGGQGQHRP